MEQNTRMLTKDQLEIIKEEAAYYKNKVSNAIDKISRDLAEREEVLKLAFLCAMTGESIFLLGPPGIAKSLVSRKITNMFLQAKSFEVLMNRYSTPDEIFGPIDIINLKEGKYVRKVQGYLPDAEVGFLDEIWKASSSIQNSLLMIINEKLFVNDGKPVKVPLVLLLAASNELPERNKGLEALWDRFIIRMDLKPIQDENKFLNLFSNPLNLLEQEELTLEEKFSLQSLKDVAINTQYVEIPENIKRFVTLLRKEINAYNEKVLEVDANANAFDLIYVSDRKWKKIGAILRTAAYLNGRMRVDITDCFLLEHMIWNTPEQLPEIIKMINKCATSIEYGINGRFAYAVESFNQIREAIINNIAVHEKRTNVIIRAYRNKQGQYYYFMDGDKNKYFFRKEDIDNIPKSENYEVMDWMLNYCTAEEFKSSTLPTKKALVKYDGTNFFLYQDANENGTKIKIFTNFEEVNIDHYRLVRPTVEFIQDIKNIATALVNRINLDLESLKVLQKKNFTNVNANNIFLHNKDLSFLKAGIDESIVQLEEIVDKVKDLFVYIKLINYGYTTKDKNRILPTLSTSDASKPNES